MEEDFLSIQEKLLERIKTLTLAHGKLKNIDTDLQHLMEFALSDLDYEYRRFVWRLKRVSTEQDEF